jgi:hypothetical protein
LIDDAISNRAMPKKVAPWTLASRRTRHPVTLHLPLDDEHHSGLLHGWSRTPTDDGALRGLVLVRREYTAGFSADYVG